MSVIFSMCFALTVSWLLVKALSLSLFWSAGFCLGYRGKASTEEGLRLLLGACHTQRWHWGACVPTPEAAALSFGLNFSIWHPWLKARWSSWIPCLGHLHHLPETLPRGGLLGKLSQRVLSRCTSHWVWSGEVALYKHCVGRTTERWYYENDFL